MKPVLSACFFSLVLLSQKPAYSQKPTGIIRGKIITANGQPAASVNVELKKLKKITVTDTKGNFSLRHLEAIEDTLIISSIDSKIYKQGVKLENGQVMNLDTVKLQYNIAQLQQVEITGRSAHSYKSDYSFFGNKTQTELKDIPQSISTVTKELIRDKMEFTLKDAVNVVAGVNQYSGYDEYTIRGFRAENPRNINGLRGYNTSYTSAMLVNIERIEVIKGPVATLYGNCDPGGTINLVTKKPLSKREATIDIYQGSWNHLRAQGDVTGPLNKSKTLLYRLNAGYDNTKSFRSQLSGESFQVAPSLSFVPNDRLKINVDFSISHISTVLDRGQPGLDSNTSLKATPISLMVNQPGDYLRETDFASVASLSYKITKNLTFNTGYLNYVTQQDVADHGLNGYITPDSIHLYYTKWNYQTVTNTLTNYLTYKLNTGKVSHQLLGGYDFVQSRITLHQQYYELPDDYGDDSGIVGTFSLKNPQNIARPVGSYQLSEYNTDAINVDGDIYHTQGIYLQDQISFNRWKLLVSVREEFYNRDEEEESDDDDDNGLESFSQNVFLPRIGLSYAVKPNINIYATYNKGFDPFEAATSTQVFNSPFKPITSELFETGVKGNFFKNKLSAYVSLYQLTVQNVAVNANDISNPNLFVQQGENQSTGVEIETSGNILPNLSVMLSYAYCVAKVTKSEDPSQVGMLVPNAPRNTSGSWIKYTFNKGLIKGFGISAGHSLVGERNTLDPAITMPGYFILNTGMHYNFKKFTLAMILNNVTNETYWTGAYNNIYKWAGAPRNYMINLSFRL